MIKYLFISLAILLLINVTYSSQYVPLSKKRPGIISGDKSNPIQIEFVYDPACSDTRDFDQKWRQTYQNLDTSLKNKIVIKYIPTIAPSHITGQKLTQAILFVLNQKGDEEALKCLRYFLDNQAEYNEAKIANETINNFLLRISQKIQEIWGITATEVYKELQHGSNFDAQTRYWAKYAMGSLTYAALPKMYINGAKVNDGTNMAQESLVKLLQTLAQ